MLASRSTTHGHLPPSSKMQGVRFLAASYATILPTKVLPVKQIKSNFILFSATATSTPPCITEYASLSRYLLTKRAMTAEDAGATSDGFKIAQLPVVIH
jgi:hypothetical protein